MTNHNPPPSRGLADRLGLRPPSTDSRVAVNVPTVVLWLVALTVIFSVVQFLSPYKLAALIDFRFGFVPRRLTLGLDTGVNPFSLAIPFFSHMFLHGNLGHLGFNMVMLVVFGAGVARRLCADWGGGSSVGYNAMLFVLFYLACGVAGAALFYIREPNAFTTMVGASGAISGLMAAVMRFALRPVAPYGVAHGPLSGIREKPVLVATIAYVGINLATGLGIDLMGTGGMAVAWDAHIGGYVFGLLAFPVVDRLARKGPDPAGQVARPKFH